MAILHIGAEAFEQSGVLGGGAAASFDQAGTHTHGAEALIQAGLDIPEIIIIDPGGGGGGSMCVKTVVVIRMGFPVSGPGVDFGGVDPGLSLTGSDGSQRLFAQYKYRLRITPDPDSATWDGVTMPTFPPGSYSEYIQMQVASRFDGVDAGYWWTWHRCNPDGSANDTSGTGWGGHVLMGGGGPGPMTSCSDSLIANSDTASHIIRTATFNVDYNGHTVPSTYVEEFDQSGDRTPTSYMVDLMGAYSSLPALTSVGFTETHKIITDAGLADCSPSIWMYIGRANGAGFAGRSQDLSSYPYQPAYMMVRGAKYSITARSWYLDRVTYFPEWGYGASIHISQPNALVSGHFFYEPDGTYTEIVPTLTYP